MDFAQYYRDIFTSFGYPLGQNAALAESTIDRAADSLNVTLPAALREFYAVAGREKAGWPSWCCFVPRAL